MKRLTTNILRAVCGLNRLNYPRFIIQTKLPPVPSDHGSFKGDHGVVYAAYPAGNDHVTKALFWFGGFDPWVVRTMKLLSGKGEIVCDVGANLGDTALPLSRHVGLEGRVLCFEPLPANVERLSANIQANDFSNVTLVPVALTETTCEMEMEIFDGQPGMAQIAEGPPSGRTIKISGIPFDDWAEANGVGTISVCKIDVQGHELSVLHGMQHRISTRRIRSFVFEHEGAISTDDPVLAFLLANDYRIYRIENRWFTNAYARLEESPKARRTRDFVAVLVNDPLEERLKNA